MAKIFNPQNNFAKKNKLHSMSSLFMECVKCGSSNESSARDCSVCGADLNVNSSKVQWVRTQADTSAEQPSSEQEWSTFDASATSEEPQPVRLVLASRCRRYGGAIVDNLVVFTLYVALGVSMLLIEDPLWYGFVTLTVWLVGPISNPRAISRNGFVTLTVWLVGPLYSWLMIGLNGGRTLGKMAMGTKVVNEDGVAPSLLTAFVREVIGKFVSAIVLGLGYIWILFDPKFQGWHDKIAGTYVIKVEK